MQETLRVTMLTMGRASHREHPSSNRVEDLTPGDIHRYAGTPLPGGTGFLVSHCDRQIFGTMQVRLRRYPAIRAETPVVRGKDYVCAITEALLRALQREVMTHSCVEAEVIQDPGPAEFADALSLCLRTLSYQDLGRSIYMSKHLGGEAHPPGGISLDLVPARNLGVGGFMSAMVLCSHRPVTDLRTQPHCLSIEGSALTLQDLAGDASGVIDRCLDDCYVAYLDGSIAAVASQAGADLIIRPFSSEHADLGRFYRHSRCVNYKQASFYLYQS
jgi:hypothetical protein